MGRDGEIGGWIQGKNEHESFKEVSFSDWRMVQQGTFHGGYRRVVPYALWVVRLHVWKE